MHAKCLSRNDVPRRHPRDSPWNAISAQATSLFQPRRSGFRMERRKNVDLFDFRLDATLLAVDITIHFI